MTFNHQDYIPQPNIWYETEISMEGDGKAEFINPDCTLEDRVRIHFDQTGAATILMTLNQIPAGLGSCTELRVETAVGVLTCSDPATSRSIHSVTGKPLEYTIRFHPSYAQFDTYTTNSVAYWVMPLTNFVTDAVPQNLTSIRLDRHPLRIFSFPELPDDFTEEEKEATMLSRSKDCIISFDLEGNTDFIEYLPDYKDRQESLISGNAQHQITALLVGETSEVPNSLDELANCIPLDLLRIFSLATGSIVGAPWFEFRDSDGSLVRRIHVRRWQVPYTKGHQAIPAFLLSVFLSGVPLSLGHSVSVAIIQMIKAGQKSLYMVEDRLAYLFRGFDALTKDIRQKHSQKQAVVIDSIREAQIAELLSKTGKAIKALSQQATDDEADAIERVSNRVYGAANEPPKKPNEAEAVLKLLDESGLHDSEVIVDQDVWVQNYNKYRNEVIHEATLKLDGGDAEFTQEVLPLLYHLHDISLRVLLKKLNYDGQYKPAVRKSNFPLAFVNWVQPGLPESDLGYP